MDTRMGTPAGRTDDRPRIPDSHGLEEKRPHPDPAPGSISTRSAGTYAQKPLHMQGYIVPRTGHHVDSLTGTGTRVAFVFL